MEEPAKQDDVLSRGKYLADVLDCYTCHSPKMVDANGMPMIAPGGILMEDTTRHLSGHPAGMVYPTWSPADAQRGAVALGNPFLTAWAGPWGVSFAANLTPDKATGLGEWTEEAFMQSIRTGKHQGQPNGREILPPMPWHAYRHLTDDDMKALWAYLRSIPAVANEVPTPVPPAMPPGAGK
jgi:hypothetical protein